jgi:hypothetical protein
MKIPIEICRIKNTPIKLVRSDGELIGVFNEGLFISDKSRVSTILREVNNGEEVDTEGDQETGSFDSES